MLNEILNDLNQPDLDELSDAYWLNLSNGFLKTTDASSRELLFQALAAHTGIPKPQLTVTLNFLMNNTDALAQKQSLLTLQETQRIASDKINTFVQQHSYCRNTDLSPLAISRKEWLAIIDKFAQQQRKVVTSVFFINVLSSLRNVSFETTTQALTKTQPAREVKRATESTPDTAPKRRRYRDDQGINRLISEEPLGSPTPLQEKLKSKNVRFTPLDLASPEKGYSGLEMKRTPGGKKVRPLCTFNWKGKNRNTFYTHVTPEKPNEGRVKLTETTLEEMKNSQPNLILSRLEPVSFIATLEKLEERSGHKRRQSQKSLTKASASDVFRANGIVISAKDGKKFHWAHLIAYFLGGAQDTVNLIPSTAAANYNTLEAIELYIRELLVNKKTTEVNIVVEPVYTGESLIPELLIYKLEWDQVIAGQTQQFAETFNINPQSHQRFTQSMYESFDEARKDSDWEPKL